MRGAAEDTAHGGEELARVVLRLELVADDLDDLILREPRRRRELHAVQR